MAKVENKSTRGGGGSAKVTATQLAKEVNSQVNTKGLSKTESKFISSMITQAARTGLGISSKEKAVILNEARKQAEDKNKAVAKNKTKNIGAFIKNEKYKLELSAENDASGNVGGGGSGGGVSSTNITTVTGDSTSNKIPNKDNVISLGRNTNDVSEITFLVFEKLGAVELTKFTRHDTVDGINPFYNIISNLSAIKKEYDASNLISFQKSNDSLYNAFSIKLENKIPGDEYLEDRGLDSYIYIDDNGGLIIELINLTSDELIEVEIDTNGTIIEVR
jgi:hypothetical protein